MDTLIALMQRDWAAITGADGKPDSTKLYRGTGYSLALGTGTLGMRLEKAGVARHDLVAQQAQRVHQSVRAGRRRRRGGRGGGGRGGPAGGASARGGGPAASVAAAAAGDAAARTRRRGAGGWGAIEIFETYNTIAPAVTLDLRGLRSRLPPRREQSEADGAARPRRAAPRRAARVQHDRHDQGHREARTST